jgi:hypothetical protein
MEGKSMRVKMAVHSLVCIILFLAMPTLACGKSIIGGQVVDADTGKPIEEAAVYINWTKSGSGPPGLAGTVRVEVAEVLTDAEGLFKVPKYSTLFKDYRIAVYKKGFVCWSSEDIFPTYEERKGFRLKDGMVIKLEPFKEEYSREAHANFTLGSSVNRRGLGLFDNAIKSEIELERKMLRRNRRK